METKEIKKAFTKMKRALGKELGITSGYYMSARQLANRTATIMVCTNVPYEAEISRIKAIMETVDSYTTWTAEEKENSHKCSREAIGKIEKKAAMFGTKENELMETLRAVSKSQSFKEFAANFDKIILTTESMNNGYYIRFNY